MLQGIDHIVIVVRELEAAAADYSALGFTVVRGGRHSGLNTHNALVAFADGCYFELIAFLAAPASHSHWWYEALQQGGGVVDFCARSDNIEDDAAVFRAAGAAIGAPFTMGRERPDGCRISWVLAVNEGATRGILPFLIRDITPRHERLPPEHLHRNLASGVERLTIATHPLDAVRSIYEKVLGHGEPVQRPDLDAIGVQFALGPHLLQLVAPLTSSGPVVERLRARGPSPIEVKLHGGGEQHGLLEPALAHGARIVIG
jgi:catechol 2,3-dioxygenase-like lactoylglutathione lyase family enzyme